MSNAAKKAEKDRRKWLERDTTARPVGLGESLKLGFGGLLSNTDRRYIAQHIELHWDDVINVKAGWKSDGPHLNDCTLGEFTPDPHPGIPSVLPVGDKPAFITLSVTPHAGSRTTPVEVAERYRGAFGYATAGVVEVIQASTLVIELGLLPPPSLRDLHPDVLEARWQELMAELHLGDTDGLFPQIVPGTFEYTQPDHLSMERLPMVADPVLAWRPPMLAFNLLPTQNQSAKDHDRIIEAIANRLGYAGIQADPFSPTTGIPVVLWRDGVPPLFPVYHDELGDLWPEVARELWADTKGMGTMPRLLTNPEWGPVEPEPGIPGMTGPVQSIVATPRPTSLRLELAVEDPRDLAAIRSVLQHKLGYHRFELNPVRNVARIDAHRDPLPKGELIPLDKITDPTTTVCIHGRTYGGWLVWDPRERAHVLIFGETGSGKGDALITFEAFGLSHDWLVFKCLGKPTAEANKLSYATIGIGDVAQVAAFTELLYGESCRRGILIQQVADGRYRDDHSILSIRDYWHYQDLAAAASEAGQTPWPTLGPPTMSLWDESSRFVSTLLEQAAPKDERAFWVALRNNFTLTAEQARASGIHLIIATQTPYYASVGGGRVVSNLGHIIMLKVIKKESFDMLGVQLDDWEKAAIKNGGGKGHCFVNLAGGVEGQGFHAGDSPDWVADRVVDPYLLRHTDHQARGRDFVVDLAIAHQMYGKVFSTEAFAKLDLSKLPPMLGHQSLASTIGMPA